MVLETAETRRSRFGATGLRLSYVAEFLGWIGILPGVWLFAGFVPSGISFGEVATSTVHGFPLAIVYLTILASLVCPGILAVVCARLYRARRRLPRNAR